SPELVQSARDRGASTAANYFEAVFSELAPAVNLTVCEPYREAPSASTVEAADAVVFTGSGVSWSTDAPEAKPLRKLMETAFEKEKPCYGSCNGMQLAAVVLGGSVRVSPAGSETGIVSIISLTDVLNGHPMMAGRTEYFSAPTVHRDEVDVLPTGAIHLACNAHCTHQAFAYQRDGVDFWGSQYHPEMRSVDVAHCLQRTNAVVDIDNDSMVEYLLCAEDNYDAAEVLGTTPQRLAMATRTIELQNWLRHVGALSNRSAA
ncbi:MAG: type 1 glutamine amidotransferase, partial [Pseudomonadota bacterium]